ncbi:unnamed protein product [Zymoseptoria tritici ST99CH_1E4]|uniref:Zn(2)-C6 fungal-type domain-containing protein n=1 Tax=Zymoseptoria tritici ST99CH_1E4 TaxID=1276532 RepID=A0A2H1GMP2_ZYMTR|nr:unnamed protein product [Zymoseptoria tritici ST99CH_1E4]
MEYQQHGSNAGAGTAGSSERSGGAASGRGGGNGYDHHQQYYQEQHQYTPDRPPQPQDRRRQRDDEDDGGSSQESAPTSPASIAASKPSRREKSEREKRTYRACLHCRQRKSRCDLYSSGEPGRPPCERCIREQHECILGGSRRGGKRVKRSASEVNANNGTPISTSDRPNTATPNQNYPPLHQVTPHESGLHNQSPHRPHQLPSWSTLDHPSSRTLPPLSHDGSTVTKPGSPILNPMYKPSNTDRQAFLGSSGPASGTGSASKMTVEDPVASTDLQNPADALEFLASVAERDSNGQANGKGNAGGGRGRLPSMQIGIDGAYGRSLLNPVSPRQSQAGAVEGRSEGGEGSGGRGSLPRHAPSDHRSASAAGGTGGSGAPGGENSVRFDATIEWPPLQKGELSLDMIKVLLYRFEEKYHPFFPLANPAAMDPDNLPTIARKEPHLLAAILTVASKDEKDWWQVHEVCSAHMQSLVASLVYEGRGSVEAVEAMLILAEWVPRRPHSTPAIGRGEEDQAAWMYVGTAVRLGYLLGIDRTGFRGESEAQSADLNRKRLAWASCYMSDRQISVRIGKAFWSRGPGPMTALRAQDFPSLQPRLHRQDNFAAIFQANLELTQLFSNAHDVLYATKSRSNQLNAGGEYVKYIDDFRVALRHWNESWGWFTCSPPLKASLILSYEYLRLYINAFAYRATLNRLITRMKESAESGTATPASVTYPFADIATTPDARFIYDAIDAAKSLLSTFCSFVDPHDTFRFMPLRYYLYVIYSAVFLYKARSTGVMAADSRGSVKRLITDTMNNLQKSSASTNDVGERYSRLIRLLWRKAPGHRGSVVADPGEITRPTTAQNGRVGDGGQGQQYPNQHPAQQHPTDPNVAYPQQQSYYPTTNTQHPYPSPLTAPPPPPPPPPAQFMGPSINQFSWLDLPAVGDFAVENNGSLAGSMTMDQLDRFEDSSADGYGGFADPGGFVVGPGMFGWGGEMGGVEGVGGAGGGGGGFGECGPGGEGVIF